MTSLLSAKKRAEEFAAVVDGRTTGRDVNPELTELADLVSALRTQQPPEPRPEFTASLRKRLLIEAEATLAEDASLTLAPRRAGTRERRLALVASSVVLVGGSTGLAAAAQSSLPGDALYPIKRGLEQIDESLSTNDAAQGRDLLGQAETRLDELADLVGGEGATSEVPGTVNAFTTQSLAGSRLLLESFEETREPAAVEDLRSFTAASLTQLQEIAKAAPAEAQDELAVAAATVLGIDEQAQSACPRCTDLPSLQMPDLFLSTAADDQPQGDEEQGGAASAGSGRTEDDDPAAGGAEATPPATKGSGGSRDGGASKKQGQDPLTLDGGEAGVLSKLVEDVGNVLGGTGAATSVPEGTNPGGTGGVTPGGNPDGTAQGSGSGKGDSVTGGVKKKGKQVLPEELDPVLDTLLP